MLIWIKAIPFEKLAGGMSGACFENAEGGLRIVPKSLWGGLAGRFFALR